MCVITNNNKFKEKLFKIVKKICDKVCKKMKKTNKNSKY